jgi:hypothetical protein
MLPISFSDALQALKEHRRVRRVGWPEGVWLRLYAPYHDREFSVRENNGVMGYDSGTLLAWIGIHTIKNGFAPWAPSSIDLLADGWEVIDDSDGQPFAVGDAAGAGPSTVDK